MKIFLIGFMGSGKSSIGRELARRMSHRFVDTDRFIEQQGMSIPQIFATRGEDAFRQMERAALTELMTCSDTVIATGGGMPCYGDNMELMLAGGTVIYLYASPASLARRLINSHTERPLIKGKTKEQLQEYIEKTLLVREPFYRRADITIDTDYYAIDRLVETLKLSAR